MKIRIDKYLSDMAIGSRKEIKKSIKNRRVKVNGEVISKSNIKIDKEKDIVLFDNEKVIYEDFIYLMLNKPKGYVSATEDKDCKTVLDLVDDIYKKRKISPVGRLDKDTEGLILLTDDGKLTYQILSPKNEVKKVYYVETRDIVNDEDKIKLEKGILLKNEGIITRESTLEELSDKKYLLTITEGKFHQVKRMFLSIDNEVKYLKRVQIGNLKLDENLKLGEYRKLTKYELENLKKITTY